MANYYFPEWLKPTSQTEDRRMRLLEQEAAQKSVSMLRKSVGLAKMKAETERLTKAGMDPETARRNAFLNNSDLLFTDNPEAIGRIMNTEAAINARQQAAEQMNRYRENLLNLRSEAEKRLTERDRELADFRSNKLASDEEKAILRAQRDLVKSQLDATVGQETLNIRRAQLDLSRSEAKSRRAEKISERVLEDTEVANLQKDISKLDQDIAATVGPGPVTSFLSTGIFGQTAANAMPWVKSREDHEELIRKREALQKELDERLKLLRADPEESGTEGDPTPKKPLRYDPTTRTLK